MYVLKHRIIICPVALIDRKVSLKILIISTYTSFTPISSIFIIFDQLDLHDSFKLIWKPVKIL